MIVMVIFLPALCGDERKLRRRNPLDSRPIVRLSNQGQDIRYTGTLAEHRQPERWKASIFKTSTSTDPIWITSTGGKPQKKGYLIV